MKKLIAIALILGFASASVFASDPPCKPGQTPEKDHCVAPKK